MLLVPSLFNHSPAVVLSPRRIIGLNKLGTGLGHFSVFTELTFHLWKNGGPGLCPTGADPNVPGCRFDGAIGKMTATILDKNCTQISFPINNGELQILTGTGVNDHKNVAALYSQTFCNINGAMFMAGGSLVVQLQ